MWYVQNKAGTIIVTFYGAELECAIEEVIPEEKTAEKGAKLGHYQRRSFCSFAIDPV